MGKKIRLVFACLLLFTACKKSNSVPEHQGSTQMFPLTADNRWVYIDSFFDSDGSYYGQDTFRLKPAKTIIQNNHTYTPLTDQFDEAIFTLRSDDSSVFILEPPGEALMFAWPIPSSEPYISNNYFGDSLNSTIYTGKLRTLGYPSYRIVVTQDNGSWNDYKSEEFYFSVGMGIIKGDTKWKNSNGDLYTSDSYWLYSTY